MHADFLYAVRACIQCLGALVRVTQDLSAKECAAPSDQCRGKLQPVIHMQAGFGMTTPDPEWHPEGLFVFDVGAEAQADHEEIVPRVARIMGNLLQAAAGECRQGTCKVKH